MLFVTKKRGDQFYYMYVNQPVASKTDPYDAVTLKQSFTQNKKTSHLH